MGIGDEGILAVGEEIDDTTINMIKEMQDEESEIVSLYYGAEVTEEAAQMSWQIRLQKLCLKLK